MRYILNRTFKLCGWKNMPYAIMNTEENITVPVSEKHFEWLFMCSGKTDIDLDAISQEEKDFFEQLLSDKIIRIAEEGEKRTLAYINYQGIYKEEVQWSITGKCNYRCRHCFQSAPHGVLGEPSFEQCVDIIRQLNECGIRKISITGGEPLIRSDFFDIVDEIRKYGMTVNTIYTNGKLVTDSFLDELEKRDLHPAFQISFDGVGCHDWMRGVTGAEKIALEAFERLRARGFYTSSSMCLCKKNVGTIRDTVQKLAQAGCSGLKFQRSMPMGEWESQSEYYLSYEETLEAYLAYLPLYKEDGMPLNIQMEGFFSYRKGEGYTNLSDRHGREEQFSFMPPCWMIQHQLYIGPNGTVAPCMSMNGAAMENLLPSVFEMPLKDILTDSSYTKLLRYRVKDVFDHTEKCHSCKYRTRCCSGCRAFAVGGSGTDYLEVDPVTCKILTEGWADRLDEIAGKLFNKTALPDEESKMKMQNC